MTGLLRPWPAGAVTAAGTPARITQDFGGTSLEVEPTGWLIRDARGPLKAARVAVAGGIRKDDLHFGIDVGLANGTPLPAVEAGTVKAVGSYRVYNPFTKRWVDEHYLQLLIRPRVRAFYTHLRAAGRLAEGTVVARGRRVAYSGHSGIVTGPHLHFEIRRKEGDVWFRYDPERLFEGGDLAGVDWITPPPEPEPPTEEDDMPPLLEYLAGQTAVIGHDGGRARIRSEPSTQVGEIVDTVAIGGSRSIGPLIGWVRGEDTEGSDRWLAWAEGTAYCYTHAINVRSVSPPAAPDCTAAIEAATAPISAALVEAQARIGAKNTALEAAAAAIQKGRDA